MRVNEKMKKVLSLLLALSMVLSYVPMPAMAAEEGTCTHHTHDDQCGYVAKVESADCTHQCSDACKTKEVKNCVHNHETAGCNYTPAAEAVACDHVHDESCNVIPANEDVAETCDHQHGNCAYREAVKESWNCGHVCTKESGCVKAVCAHVCPGDDCGFVAAAGHACEFVCAECESQSQREDAVQESSPVDAAKARVEALPTTEQAAAMTEAEKDALSLQLTALDNDLWALVEEEVLPMEEYIQLYEVIDELNAVLIEDVPQFLADVAEVNGTKYASLGEAYNAVPDGGTVTLLANCTVDTFTTEKSFTLDLNGNTITGNITVRDGTLSVKDTGTGGQITGALKTTWYDLAGTTPRINITGGKIGSVRNASGTGGITISGGTIGQITHYSGTLNVTGGTITAETGIYCDNVQGSVNISGGTFNCTTDIRGYGILPINLTGGTFNNGITVERAIDLAEILAENYRYYVNGSEEPATLSAGQMTLAGSTVTVRREPYTIADPYGINCTVSVDKKTARPGETVTITVIPDSGYALQSVSALCNSGSQFPGILTCKKVNETTYTFTMPSADVYLIHASAKVLYTITFKDSAQQCTAHGEVKTFEGETYYLPNCNHTHSDSAKNFAGWLINGAVKQPGDVITISGNVTIDHKWGNKVTDISLSEKTLEVTFYPDCYNPNMSSDELLALFGELSRSLTATIIPDTATNKNINWSISDNNIVTLLPQGATAAILPKNLSSLSEGTAVITAASAENPNIKAVCTVTYKKHQCTDTTYSVNRNTITETCLDPKCGKTNTVTLTVPGDSTYDGTPKKAAQQGTFLNPNANPQIIYQFNAEKAEGYAAHTGDPVNAGYYTAMLKVGEVSTNAQPFVISKKPLTNLAIVNTEKEYDGTVAANNSYISCEGVVEADAGKVTITADIAYDSAAAGNNKRITGGNITLSGEKAGNYYIPEGTTEVTGMGTIAPKSVTVTADDLSKTYGDADPAELTCTTDNVVQGETLEGITLKRAEGEAAGTYEITVDVDANANPNYTITQQNGTFTIDPKELTVNLKVEKQFDNTPDVDKEKDTFEYELAGVVGEDQVELNADAVTAAFRQAGTDEDLPVDLTGDFTLTGAEDVLKNYTLTQPSGVTGTIYNYYNAFYDFAVSHGGWTNGEVTITAVPGCQLATDINGEWADKLTYTQEAATVSGNKAAFYVKNADGDISLRKEVLYFIDKTNPTGTIALKDREPWQVLLNKISFELFYNYEQTVTITAQDTLSDVAKIEYLESSTGLDQAALDTASWTEYTGPISVTLENNAKLFVYFAKITDNAGNVTYLSTDGAVYDTSAPVISIEAGTYYTTQSVSITEDYLDTLTLNGKNVTAPITLEGDKEADYTIVAKDKAGNETTVTVTMMPIASLDDAIEDLTENNATSADRDDIQSVLDDVNELLDENGDPDEQAKLNSIKTTAENLIDAIEDAADAINTKDIQKVQDKDSSNVELEDKEDLEKAKEALEDALKDENKGNYTEAEQEAIQDEVDRISDAIQAIEETEAVIDAIEELPKSVETDLDEKTEKAIRDAKAAYDKLTDHQKSLIGRNNRNKLEKLFDVLDDYKITKGSGSKWEKGSGKTLVFIANGPDRKFKELRIDGKVVSGFNYTHKDGSTIITLRANYLQTLSTGKHTIQVVYTDGETDGKDYFHIRNSGSNPSTGDNMNLILMGGVAMTSLLCMAMMVVFFPRKKGKYQR